MAEKTEAQRLAAALDALLGYRGINADVGKAAAELRRLDAVNAQLLEALKSLVSNEDARSWGVFGVDNRSAFTKARAAIKAAKGEA
jgi:hypothetical protein